ncbi:TRAP transporter substrate-binding protein DctP [Halomonas dongshanensis]|uniref:TRAP transporter substrate-binding protein DctP n=1 Tax=Halomonas dongshanensis TaxID=2890835 RepID=A0ABT2EGN0_9GAMM|nr:TRAP transporter substrate-binding protein DctP [Halomonas dongshanensis]MCS2609787.1 TRAP transporter substrate-binding protein DctP [Halomonas dongshanensis]
MAHADNWTAYTYSSVSTTAAVQGMNRIAESVREETDGDLSMRLHLGKTLHIASSDITQAVGDGIVDFAADLFFAGNVPIGRILSLPMLIENDNDWEAAYAVVQPYLEDGFAQQGVHYLGNYRYPQQVIFTNFEINSLDDLENHRIRVTSPEQGAFVEAFGGSPITLSGTEVPTALERGVIDGVLTASAGGAKNWHEFLPYNYRLPVNYGYSVIIANQDAYDAQSPQTQSALQRIVAEEGHSITDAFVIDEQTQKSAQMEAGMTVVDVTPEEIARARDALSPFWQEWAEREGPEYQRVLEEVLTAIDR